MASPRAQQVTQLARAGRWWDAAAAARTGFDDPDTMLAGAHAWVELGLGTFAAGELDRLCSAFPAAERHERVIECRRRIAALPPDRVDPGELAHRVTTAAAALAARGIDLGDVPRRWLEAAPTDELFRAADGNTVRRRSNGSLELVGDHRAASRALVAQHAQTLVTSPAPILIEGLDPPWLALGAFAATDRVGYSPGIRIVQADPLELLDGCSLADADELAALIAATRVEWFVGPSACSMLAESIAGEPGVEHEGPVVPLATLRSRVGPGLGAAVKAATRRHASDHAGDVATIRERDRSRETLDRLAAALRDTPRVALIAGRFTTVLRPMIDDLAAALRAQGCDTRIISEPSDHRRLSRHAYSRACAEFDPDLIICANHTRDDIDRLLGEHVMPKAVPWVTWVQDAMPHLLRPEAGRAIGPHDLAIGFISPAMRNHFGYPADRAIDVPMVASEQKFSPDRVDASLSPELACEIAAFTNHSETPAQMRARLIDEVSGSPAAAAVVERVADRALALADEPIERIVARHRCAALLDDIAPGADAESRENLFENVALRLYDRACRHRALGWAQAVCDANGWRLAIYGAGWHDHPTLAPHARGSLSHGVELCTAYHAARVSLDTSTLSTFHQRTAECALAGGLPAVLATGTTCLHARVVLKHRLVTDCASLGFDVPNEPTKIAFATVRVREARRFAAFGSLLFGRSYPYAIVESEPVPPIGMGTNADEAIGLLELGVWNPSSLEQLVLRAGDSTWRDAHRTRVLAFVRNNCTHAVLAKTMLESFARLADAQTAAA